MKLRRPSGPAWVRRLVVPARMDAWLAAAVGALTLGAVVCLERLAREVRLDRVPDWLPVSVGVVVLLAAVPTGGGC